MEEHLRTLAACLPARRLEFSSSAKLHKAFVGISAHLKELICRGDDPHAIAQALR